MQLTQHLALPLVLGLLVGSAQAQHLDVLLQVVDGQIVTGEANYDTNTWLVGQNVYKRQLLSNYRTSDPGFTTLETGNPLLESGVLGFSSGVDVFVDIVPSTIDGLRANFWYWDGLDVPGDGFSVEDVAFGPAPEGVTWNLFDEDFQLLTADGSDTVVPDALVQTTFSDGAIHNHLIMQVAASEGDPPEGVYLAAFTAHADGFEDSEPFFFIHRTSTLTDEPRNAAAQWVEDNYDSLTEPPLAGDYNSDGVVDAADYTVWRDTLDSTTDLRADGDDDGQITTADYGLWHDNFGAMAAASTLVSTSAPEPHGIAIAAAALFALTTRRGTPRRRQFHQGRRALTSGFAGGNERSVR